MATSPGALVRGVPQRALLPTPYPDGGGGSDVAFPMDPYGAVYVQAKIRKAHSLADEGSYYTAGTATGIVPTYATAISATAPFITIYNGNLAKNLYLDYVALTAIVAGIVTTTVGYTALNITVDSGNRYASGGTQLIGLNVNLNAASNSGATIFCGAITATAGSVNARTVVPLRNIRPGVSSTVVNVIGDMNLLNFGSVEGAVGSIVVANANIMPQALPPIVLPPGTSCLISIWYAVSAAPSAATYSPEIGFWVR
jgi:hypothetical protein